MVKKILQCWLMIMLAGGLSCSEGDSPAEPEPPDESQTIYRVPGDYPNIQAAVDAASEYDTVLVAPGIYGGPGNRDIDLVGRRLVLKSEMGPQHTTIRAWGSSQYQHRVFQIQGATDGDLIIDGFTVAGGYMNQGGAMSLASADPTVRNCIFVDNTALLSGGAIRCKSSSPTFTNCTFVHNSAPEGGTLYCIAGSRPIIDRCIVISAGSGDAVKCNGNTDVPMVVCSDIFAVEGDGWSGCLDSLSDRYDNMSSDPMFCEPVDHNFRLRSGSPCLPDENDCGELMGALGESICN